MEGMPEAKGAMGEGQGKVRHGPQRQELLGVIMNENCS